MVTKKEESKALAQGISKMAIAGDQRDVDGEVSVDAEVAWFCVCRL